MIARPRPLLRGDCGQQACRPPGLALLNQSGRSCRTLQWFSVGAATAQILADHGLDVSYPAAGDDSEALLELPQLREAIARPDARVLIMRGEGGRELLAERLREQGASVDYLELYRRCLPHMRRRLVQRIQRNA